MNFAQRKKAMDKAKAGGAASAAVSGAAFAFAPGRAAAAAPFEPAFLPQAYILNMQGETEINRSALNMNYFATEETAAEMQRRHGADSIELEPYPGENGPGLVCDPPGIRMQVLVYKSDGFRVNAGVLAAYYKEDRNPEALFPGLADKLVSMQLAADRAMLAQMKEEEANR